jgi:Acetyltransferase (GNAT) domain
MQKTALEMLEAANPVDSERWNTLVSNSPAPDVYYMPAYARASAEIEHSEPVAILGGPDSGRFLAPLLLRRMSAVVNSSRIDWTDACSPYGYGGLVPLSIAQSTDVPDLRGFLDDLHDWSSTRDVACCVLRLHPLMKQEEWFTPEEQSQKFLRLRLRGSTTAIDLEDWDDVRDRPFSLRKDRRSDLNVARRSLRITWTSAEDPNLQPTLDRFSALYEQAMESRHADSFFRFPASYFSRLASLGSGLCIALAWLDDQLAGGSIFLAGRDYSHYHLACGNEIGMKYRAATLLVVEGAKWARRQGCKLLHLGGGLDPGDSLEFFKFSFGGRLYRYAYLISIVNPERFEQLCQMPNAPWPYQPNEILGGHD